MPIFTRRVRAAMAVAMTSGEESTERSFWKWISASQTASKPQLLRRRHLGERLVEGLGLVHARAGTGTR